MSAPTERVSVIIPVYNRSDAIGLTLGSFDAQLDDPSRIEIVAVDDGSSDDSIAEIERFQKQSNLHLTTLQQNHLGPSSARNNGAKNAQHELLLFWDADMIAESQVR